MGIKSFLNNFTQGRPQQEPPTPYTLAPRAAGLGIGVSNFAFQQSHTPPMDSYRGRQGIQVLRNLMTLEGACYIPFQANQVFPIVALPSGVNTLPGLTALAAPNNGNQGG